MIVGPRRRARFGPLVGFAIAVALIAARGAASHRASPRAPAPVPAGADVRETCRPATPDEIFADTGLIERRFERDDGCVATGADDLDADGVADCWSAGYNGGHAMGEWRATIQRGCDGPVIHAASGWLQEDPLDVIDVPDDPRLAAGIAGLFHGAPARTHPSPAMQWILDTASPEYDPGRYLSGPLEGLPLGAPRSYTPNWQPGLPRAAEAETYLGARSLVHADAMSPLAKVASCDAFEVWATWEAVAVVDRATGRWSWILMTAELRDDRPTYGLDLDGIQCAGELVFIQRLRRYEPWREVVISAPRLARWRSLVPGGPWFVGDDGLELDDEDGNTERQIPLAALVDMLTPVRSDHD